MWIGRRRTREHSSLLRNSCVGRSQRLPRMTRRTFGLSVFLRDRDNVYHTYFTSGRGVEYLGSNFSYLDLTLFGRQEVWENSPEGWPQTPLYEWWRHHDRY